MERVSKDERILSLESKLKSLTARLSDLERRLSVLERGAGIPRSPKSQAPGREEVKHVYLRRAISTARRDYERKYK